MEPVISDKACMDALLDRYAELVVRTGVNIRRGQLLVVNSPIECAGFARRIAKAAFEAGAGDVAVDWSDEQFARVRFEMAEKEVFGRFPAWRRDMYMDRLSEGAAFVSIHATDPDVFRNVDPEKLLLSQRTAGTALREYHDRMMNDENRWCVVSVPTEAWASRVFPGRGIEEAVALLWKAIFQAVRIRPGGDPVAEWAEHTAFLAKASAFLNAQAFAELHFTNGLGTDLHVKLPRGHVWEGGASTARDGVEFVANMPTEEVFTMPDRCGVDGVVYATRPLNFRGRLIEGMRIRFEQGRAVEATATEGQDALDSLLAADEGAVRLGEVALVPHDSPISAGGILFYNTLFDENASCHLAFGKAYPTCIEGGSGMGAEELRARGANDSIVHEDFMIGSADMDITGIRGDGTCVPVFRRGTFAGFAG